MWSMFYQLLLKYYKAGVLFSAIRFRLPQHPVIRPEIGRNMLNSDKCFIFVIKQIQRGF